MRLRCIFVHREAFLLIDWLVECDLDTRLGVEDLLVDVESELERQSSQRRIVHGDGIVCDENTASRSRSLVWEAWKSR